MPDCRCPTNEGTHKSGTEKTGSIPPIIPFEIDG